MLDVREHEELLLAALPRALHIPMNEIPRRLGELDPRRRVVVLCHHGIRSAVIAGWLDAQGFTDVANLGGGIDAWAREVDPSVGSY